jgi:hypothetical protein
MIFDSSGRSADVSVATLRNIQTLFPCTYCNKKDVSLINRLLDLP